MSNPLPDKVSASNPRPGAPTEKSRIELPTEEHLRTFWVKNRNAIYIGCAAVIVAILARGTYEQLAARREAGIEAAFAAATTPAKLQAFVRDNDRHPLAGAAYLQLADKAYTDSRFDEARGCYEKAAAILSGTPFAARATLGQGICLLATSKAAEGTAILRKLADDGTQLQAVRCEAAFHLASLAFDNGKFDDVVKLTDLIMQSDANSIWARRALLLRVRTPVSTTAAPVEAKGETAPAVSIKLPGS